MKEFDGRIGHLEGIESPWANAGGVVKTVEDFEAMARTGVGWIEAGSYTLEGRVGNGPNGERVYYHSSDTGETFNSLGMPNKGMDIVEQEIPEMVRIAHAYNKKLVVNVAPVTTNPVEETQELVARAYAAGADWVLVNAGCPNVKDEFGNHEILSKNSVETGLVLRGLTSVVARYKPVALRITPQENPQAMGDICEEVCFSKNVNGLFTPNTWVLPLPRNEQDEPILEVNVETCGQSGPALFMAAALQTAWAATLLRDTGIDVISSSSIMNGKELRFRMASGAKAGAGTTFYYESQNGWEEDTDKQLWELAA